MENREREVSLDRSIARSRGQSPSIRPLLVVAVGEGGGKKGRLCFFVFRCWLLLGFGGSIGMHERTAKRIGSLDAGLKARSAHRMAFVYRENSRRGACMKAYAAGESAASE